MTTERPLPRYTPVLVADPAPASGELAGPLIDKARRLEACNVADIDPARVAEVEAECDRLSAEVAALRGALERIERWHGEFPPTGKTWGDGTTMSYAAFRANGEREFMRDVARAALSATPPAAVPVTGFGRWIGPEEDRVTRLLIHAAMAECDDEWGANPSDELIAVAAEYRAWEYEQPELGQDQSQEADQCQP